MARFDALSITAVLGCCAYYLFAWAIAGRDPKRGTIVPLYEPPCGFSPAMMRYVWKEHYDDRAFWASVLSLVAKNLANLQVDGGEALLRPEKDGHEGLTLPAEERLLFKKLQSGSRRKGMSISLLDSDTAFLASKMADSLRQAAVGRWFQENRNYVVCGIALSVLATCLVSRPSRSDEWVALVMGLAVMAPGAFYLLFLLLRIRDVCRSAKEKIDSQLVRRAAMLFALAVPCVAAIILGSVVLVATFGWFTIAAVGLLGGLGLLSTQVIKAPTAQGRIVLDQIEGFRLFLQTVERAPLNREEAPGNHAGSYEKYLPYAVALEVDQQWSDKLVALTTTLHRCEKLAAAHSFYLGMWDGRPVEMVFKPEPPRR